MRWVDIPYEIIENKLARRKVEWPQRCPCCGQDHQNNSYSFGTRVSKSTTFHSTTSKSETYFPVGFSSPYCVACKKHADPSTNIMYIYIVGFFLWVAVGWLIFINGLAYEPLGIVMFLLSAGLIGGGCYFLSKALINVLSKSRMKPSCTNHAYAMHASPYNQNIRIMFYNDEYANDFARLNNLEIYKPVEEMS